MTRWRMTGGSTPLPTARTPGGGVGSGSSAGARDMRCCCGSGAELDVGVVAERLDAGSTSPGASRQAVAAKAMPTRMSNVRSHVFTSGRLIKSITEFRLTVYEFSGHTGANAPVWSAATRG